MKAYYNEFDSNAAAWLRELIKMKLITDGVVDERSIVDVDGKELREFDRIHLFAGIGGWEYALQLAGFEGRVFTGSCPCQPFSSAGNQKGKSDERHLWPHMFRLIRECRPEIVLGEQVDGAIKHGWIDDLCDDLERENYAVRAQVLAAACVGAPHIRKRLYWGAFRVAHTTGEGLERTIRAKLERERDGYAESGAVDGMAYTVRGRQQGQGELGQPLHSAQSGDREVDRVINAGNISNGDSDGRMGNTEHDGQFTSTITTGDVQPSEEWWKDRSDVSRQSQGTSGPSDAASVSGRKDGCGDWHNPDWIYCRDGKYRPIHTAIKPTLPSFKSSTFKMADGLSRGVVSGSDPSAQINANETQEARTMRLKGYGNAIVPQLAAEFIKSNFLGY